MPTVFECVSAFIWQIVNIRFERDSGVYDICFPLTSTTFNYFVCLKTPGVVQNIAFHITPTATYLV